MKKILHHSTAVVFLAVAASAAATETPLADLDVVYAVNWAGLDVGSASVTLKHDGAAGCYLYTTTTQPVGFVKALYGAPKQLSRFCVKAGRVQSQQFESVLAGDEKQSYTLNFDYTKGVVIDENGASREIPEDAVDSFSLQQAVRLWVSAHAKDEQAPIAEFTMVDRKNLTHYQFRLAGHETIQTPAGSFDTLKMERIDTPDKIGRFWLAPERGYMPVKIETKNGGKPAVLLVLKQ